MGKGHSELWVMEVGISELCMALIKPSQERISRILKKGISRNVEAYWNYRVPFTWWKNQMDDKDLHF